VGKGHLPDGYLNSVNSQGIRTRASVHGESVSFDTESQDEVQDESVTNWTLNGLQLKLQEFSIPPILFGWGLNPHPIQKAGELSDTFILDHPSIPSLNKEGTKGWLIEDEAFKRLKFDASARVAG